MTRLAWLAVVFALAACRAGAATWIVAQQDPRAADTNPGSEVRPLRTIQAAMSRLQPGDTIQVKSGCYREAVTSGDDWQDPERRSTLAAFPGHRPTVCGSDPLPGPWERLPGDRPVYRRVCDTVVQMAFCDGARLQQIGVQGNLKRAADAGPFSFQRKTIGQGPGDLTAGSFHYDPAARQLYVWLSDGGQPDEHLIEVAVRDVGITLRGTWTLSGFDVKHIRDGGWPREQAVAVAGPRCVVEGCRVTQNDFLGLIVSGEDATIRGNEIAHNGLMGFTSNYGYRVLFEGNELHHNAWRGDVRCLTAGNKYVMWRDCRWIGNWWHDEPAAALWLDISDANALIAENRFDDCACGLYFEISRWAVIANNVFRRCGRGAWIYSSDALVAHNVFDGCGEGVTITGYPRTANLNQAISEPGQDCLMAVRNNLVVNNLLIDCVGSYVGITEDSAFGAGNFSDYNAFVWTLPVYHPTGNHLNFMNGWHTLYGRLPEWRYQRHYDTHSVVVDAHLAREQRGGSPWLALGPGEILDEARCEHRAAGDYRLRPDSPLHGRGRALPAVLRAAYQPGAGHEVVSRMWASTVKAGAPDRFTGAGRHYRLQPLPGFRRLVDLDEGGPATPGLNAAWRESRRYPVFDAARPAEQAGESDWTVFADNRLLDPSFEASVTRGGAANGPGPWYSPADLHTYAGMACANLLPAHQQRLLAWQPVGRVAPETEYLVFGDATVGSAQASYGATAEVYLATGDSWEPAGEIGALVAAPQRTRGWQTVLARYRAGRAGQDARVGQPLAVVIAARVSGPATPATSTPVALARWDNLVFLRGDQPAR